MPGYSPNSDNRVADLLYELKRHIKSCRNCQGAMKTRDRDLLCDHTIGLILTAAYAYDSVIPRRIKTKRNGHNPVYACPDLSAHGKVYSLTAEPLIVAGIEQALF